MASTRPSVVSIVFFTGISLSSFRMMLAAGALLLGAVCMPAGAVPPPASNLTFVGTQITVPTSGLSGPNSVGVDSASNVYILDSKNLQVVKVTPSGAQSVFISGLQSPTGIAVDGAGDVFIADSGFGGVAEILAGGGANQAASVAVPQGAAVDSAGNLFVSDSAGNVWKFPPPPGHYDSSYASNVVNGLSSPQGMAVDAAGDVFIADTGNNRVVEILAAGVGQATVGSGLSSPQGVAVDSAGNLYIADTGNSRVVEVPAGGGPQITLSSGLLSPASVAVDRKGDVFVANSGSNSVVELQAAPVNFGNVNVCLSGSTPAPCSQTLTLNYSVSVDPTFGAVDVVTQGLPNRDFQLSGTTCTSPIAAPTSCSVNVTFAPLAPGLRMGAVQLLDGGGNLLATTFISGVGQGPVSAFSPAAQTTLASGTYAPHGVAVDAAGDVFFAAPYSVIEIPAGCTSANCQTLLSSGFGDLEGMAVDGAGDVFIANSSNNQVVEIMPNGTETTIGTGFKACFGVAVDGAGDLFIADTNNHQVVEVTPGGVQTTVSASGLVAPEGIAVDSAGNLFIADHSTGLVVEEPAGGGAQITVASGLPNTDSLAVDAAGDLFFADDNVGRVAEISAGTSTPISVGSGYGVAVGAAGDVYVADPVHAQLVEVLRTQPPSLTFASPTPVGTTSSDGPQTVTVHNIGNQPLTANAPGLAFTASSPAPSFSQASVSAGDCTPTFSLTPGASCNLSINFTPSTTGPITGDATLTDNDLNASAVENIQLQGTGSNVTTTISISNIPGTAVYGGNFTPAFAYTGDGATSATSSTTNTCTVTGGVVSFVGAGACKLTANALAGPIYSAVNGSPQMFTIAQATPNILVTGYSLPYDGTPHKATVAATGINPSVDLSSEVNLSLTTHTAAGTYTLDSWTFTDSAGNYSPTSGTVSDTISKAIASVTPNAASKAYGTADPAFTGVLAGFISTDNVTATYSRTSGETVKGGPYPISGTIASNPALSDYNITYNTAPFTINPAAQAISFTPIPPLVSPVVLSATASSGLPVTFTVSGPATISYNILAITGPGTVVVAADQVGSLNYLSAPEVSQTLVIGSPSAQTINFPAIPNQVMGGTNLIAVTVSASSLLPTLLTSTTPSVCSVTGTAVSLLSYGECSIQATQAGNAFYLPVGPLTQSFTVAQETLGTTTLYFGSAAASGSIEIGFQPYPTSSTDFTASAPWKATSSPFFVHLAGNATSVSGNGAAVLPFTLDANPSQTPRTVNITLDSGQVLLIKQAGTNYVAVSPLTKLQSTGLNNPTGMAIDGSGNVVIADSGNNAIEEWIPAPTLGPKAVMNTLVSSGLSNPTALAVDGSGNVYIADTGNHAIEKWNAATQTLATLVSGLNQPQGIAVDRAGNVYFSDGGSNIVTEWSAATQAVLANPLVSTGLLHPMGVAVDSAGNVYIADSGHNAIQEWSVTTRLVTTLVSSGLLNPTGVAVDGSGNVYIADNGDGTVKELNAYTQLLTPAETSGFTAPAGVAVDGAGNVYIADNNAVSEILYAFLAPGSYTEPATVSTLSLFPLIPSTAALTGPFSPTTDQPTWIDNISILNGAVTFTVESNVGNPARVGHLTVLGQVNTINQYGTGSAQTITFNPLANRAYGSAPFTVSATASSGLAVSFNSQTTSVCTISGSTVTLLSVGTCTIQATQAGSSPKWASAPSVSQSLTVTPASQTITFTAIPNTAKTAGQVTLTATASSGMPVSLASATPTVCTVSGITATLVTTGTCTIQASQAGGGNYAPATAVNQSFFVTSSTQAITFGTLSPRVLGSGTFTVSATASSKLTVSFNSQSTAVCTVSGSTVTLVAVGTCAIQATQAGNATYAAAPSVNQSFSVSQGSQTVTFAALPNRALSSGSFRVSATASSGLTVSFTSLTLPVCTVSGSTVTLVAVGTCTIQASQAGNASYTAATPVPQTFFVTPSTQTITFGALSSRAYGSGSFGLTATASSGLTVSFASTTSSVCTVSGATVSLVAAGTCSIQATQAGNATYAAATAVNQSFSVTKGSQNITFAQLPNVTFATTKSFKVSATSTSGLTVSIASTTSTVCSVSSTTVTLKKTGTCTIQASQSGNGNYTAAPVVNNAFTVQ
jgi:sugar lactone lactonase YvrE